MEMSGGRKGKTLAVDGADWDGVRRDDAEGIGWDRRWYMRTIGPRSAEAVCCTRVSTPGCNGDDG